MTTQQLANFNRAVDCLFERDYQHSTLEGLAIKYGITRQQVAQLLTHARFNNKILNAVELRLKLEREKWLETRNRSTFNQVNDGHFGGPQK